MSLEQILEEDLNQLTTELSCSTHPAMPDSISDFLTCRPMNYGGGNNDLNLLKLFVYPYFDQTASFPSARARLLSFRVSGVSG